MSRFTFSRRGFLGVAGGVVAAAGVGAGIPWLARPAEIGTQLTSRLPLPQPFTVPLPVPPVATPTGDHYEITQQVATKEILPGVPTEIWGFNGIYPGPTIVSQSGQRTIVRHRNHLPAPTVVHLHGGHTPPLSDGYPTDLVFPAGMAATPAMAQSMGMAPDPRAVLAEGTRDYDYPLRQRATTLWYHDHRMGFTGASVYRGLAGFHLIHDQEELALPLPRGDRDVPIMLADRAFAADGSLVYPAVDPTLLHTPGVTGSAVQGVLGDVILANGAPWPAMEVDAARYRFRFLNASNARRYGLALDPPPPGGAGLIQIGSDGGLLRAPIPHDQIQLSPAERFDVVIDFSRYRVGQQVVLRNLLGTGTTANVMRFHIVRPATDDTHIPARLTEIDTLNPSQATTTRDFSFLSSANGWTINGQAFDPRLINANPTLGDTEIWRFVSDFHHSIHLHLVQFQVLSRDGRAPGPYDAGWKDTVDTLPAQAITVIARFTDYRGRFIYHCHNLEHEDMGMMANFEVG
ncbi:MAG TPA: multicopper oxidase family protein [Pseudonocardiaceae bacterium]|nr:multicopper oxidase family protein [Pseudonocardiaceae bacterium]